MKRIIAGTACVFMLQAASALYVTTGDLGPLFVTGASGGSASVHLSTPHAASTGLAKMVVKQGLWNSPGPEATVSISVNDTFVGQFTTAGGYAFPGPVFSSFLVPQAILLTSTPNVIAFRDVNPIDSLDYIIGEVSMDYSGVPEPMTLLPVVVGLAALQQRRKRRA